MQIFKNRPLFCAFMSFMFCSVLFFMSDWRVKLVFASVSVLGIVGVVILKKCGKISLHKFLTSLLCLIFVFLAAAVSYIYFDVILSGRYDLNTGDKCRAEATVIEESYSSGGSSQYKIHVSSVNGRMVNFTAVLKCEYLGGIKVGNVISGNFTVGEFQENIGAYKEKDMMLAEGILVCLNSSNTEDFKVVKDRSNNVFVALGRLNKYLSNKIILGLGDEDGSLASSLLLGNSKLVPDDIARDFRRVGASHILAISGTHMSILFGTLALILQWMFIPYKVRAVILSFLSVFYLALTNFSMSATRSVLMLLMVYFSMLFSHKADSLTSLSAAGALILGFTPFAVVDAGFWMSFAATFGILVYIPHFQSFTFEKIQPYYSKYKWIISPAVSLATAILTSLCAIAPLVIVLCIFTREISVFAVLSSLVLALPTQIILLFTPIYLLVMNIPALGNAVYLILKLCCRAEIRFCRTFSLKENSLISIDYGFVTLAALLLGITLFLCMLVKFRRRWLAPTPFLCALAIFFVIIGIKSNQNSETVRISYVNQGEGRDMILATDVDKTILIDMTTGYSASINLAFDEMSKLNATEIDAYILTHYTTSHISSLSKSFKKQIIRKLYLPHPQNNDDYFRMISIMDCAEENGVTVDFFDFDVDCHTMLDGLRLNIKRDFTDRSAVPAVMVEMDVGENKLTYLSASYSETGLRLPALERMYETDCLIFGSRGPAPKKTYKIQNGSNIREIIFSSKKTAAYYDTSSYVFPDTRLVLCPEKYRYVFEKD